MGAPLFPFSFCIASSRLFLIRLTWPNSFFFLIGFIKVKFADSKIHPFKCVVWWILTNTARCVPISPIFHRSYVQMRTRIFTATQCRTAPNWKHHKCLSTVAWANRTHRMCLFNETWEYKQQEGTNRYHVNEMKQTKQMKECMLSVVKTKK